MIAVTKLLAAHMPTFQHFCNCILPLHHVRAFEQLPGWLLPQHKLFSPVCPHVVRRIGLRCTATTEITKRKAADIFRLCCISDNTLRHSFYSVVPHRLLHFLNLSNTLHVHFPRTRSGHMDTWPCPNSRRWTVSSSMPMVSRMYCANACPFNSCPLRIAAAVANCFQLNMYH